MKTKERYKEKETWIVARGTPNSAFTATTTVQRHDVITYSENKPAYVSFNTCSHTRGYSGSAANELRIPCTPVASGQNIEPVGGPSHDRGFHLPCRVNDLPILTHAYTDINSLRDYTARDYDASVYDAVLAAYAQARSIPSILQPVIELKDVKQTAKQATALCDWLLHRPSSIRKYMREGASFGRVIKDFIRSTVDQSSNAYLMSTFGILPTVGDAQRIARSVASPNKFVKARSNVIPKNTVLKAGFRCPTDMPPFDMSARIEMKSVHRSKSYTSPYWDGLSTTPGITPLAQSILGSKRSYRVTDIHGLVFIKARVDTEVDNSLLSDWNYTQTPGSIPWELVPFSFVVDWFYDVGDQLQRAEKRSNVYRRVRIRDFSQPWVCTHRDRYTLSAAVESSTSILEAYYNHPMYGDCTIFATYLQKCVRKALKNYVSREFARGPWQGHLYDLPAQDFSLPVRPYQVAASLALLAQKFLSLGRN